MNRQHLFFISLLLIIIACTSEKKTEMGDVQNTLFCNPINISYRFCVDTPSRREAADPTVLFYKDRYFLFASKSGGYWYSKDLHEWTFIETNEIPVEEYAPTVIAIEDTVYFLASSDTKSTIYKSTDMLSGKWSVAVDSLETTVWDPAFFLDDDKRLYLYWGCSNENPIYGVEVDYKNGFTFIGEKKALIYQNPDAYGWEVPGNYNTIKENKPWIEGAWMNKIDGRYFLQIAGPGTEFKSYADAVYYADSPLGTFHYQKHNPISYKPEGFVAGAGHGCTFSDKFGNLWHMATATISVKHMFERRLVLYPVFYDEDSLLYAITRFGDYPFIIPDKKIDSFDEIFAGQMLLSFDKPVIASSSLDSFPTKNITDENIRTYWSAESDSDEEYLILDLEEIYDVQSIQINFAEHNTSLQGRQADKFHTYVISTSVDKNSWDTLINESQSKTDNTHEFFQLPEVVNCRYVKVSNIAVPDGNFAISDLRVFGNGQGNKPQVANTFIAQRDYVDRRVVNLNWSKVDDAVGYNICFGIDTTKLYQNYIVYKDTTLSINTLNVDCEYVFSVQSFNKNGISECSSVVVIE